MSEHFYTHTTCTLFSKSKNCFLDLWYFEDDDLDEFDTEQFIIRKDFDQVTFTSKKDLENIFNQWLAVHKKIQDEYNFEIVEVEISTRLK